uniref:Uncharacterized protein n=1 Tax=Arundo donax TaxID=35708 RepID=A0A0A8ZXI9_ARUDO
MWCCPADARGVGHNQGDPGEFR